MTEETLNNHAMQMIVHAGDARNHLNLALDALYEGNEEAYRENMAKAKEESVAAHVEQTKVLHESVDEKLELTVLFTHAQDTLMTVMSEMNVSRHLAKIIRKIEEMKSDKS